MRQICCWSLTRRLRATLTTPGTLAAAYACSGAVPGPLAARGAEPRVRGRGQRQAQSNEEGGVVREGVSRCGGRRTSGGRRGYGGRGESSLSDDGPIRCLVTAS